MTTQYAVLVRRRNARQRLSTLQSGNHWQVDMVGSLDMVEKTLKHYQQSLAIMEKWECKSAPYRPKRYTLADLKGS